MTVFVTKCNFTSFCHSRADGNFARPVSSTFYDIRICSFATFDGPARAIHCAGAIRDAVTSLGFSIRVGLHTGECEVMDEKVAGIAVHIGARVMSHAAPGEVLVSSTVKDLVAGSGLIFVDRGVHALKGVPGERHPFAAVC